MAVPSLTRAQVDEVQVALEAVQRDFAPLHRKARASILSGPPHVQESLGAWLDAFVALADEVTAWELAAEQADVPELTSPLDLPRFEALAATPLSTEAGRVLLASSERLGDARVLALAALIVGQAALRAEVEAELTRTRDVEATWQLVDWLGADAHGGILAALTASRARAAQVLDDTREDDATRWLLQRGFEHTEPFGVSIRMQDVSPQHPRRSHLRDQASFLEVMVSTKRVRGPELDPSWTLVLRGARGEPMHGFTPSRWSGSLWCVQRDAGAQSAVFTEESAGLVRKGRTQVITTTLEAMPDAIDAIETMTGRSFHREGAAISASIGEKRSVKLEEATRAWLLAP